MTEWLIGAFVYIIMGLIVCPLSENWAHRYVDVGNDRPTFVDYLIIVMAWPLFLMMLIADWIDGPPRA